MLKLHRTFRPARTCRHENDPVVQNGLAVTPSQMADLASRGIPISTQNAASFTSNDVGRFDFDVPMEHTRGIDMAEMWQKREDVKSKFRETKRKLKSGELSPYVEPQNA